MSLFERARSEHLGPPSDAQHDATANSGSNTEAEDAAAHIADMVRRTAQRNAGPGPSSVARPEPTVEQQQPLSAPPVVHHVPQPDSPPARTAKRRPSPRALGAIGAVAAVLIAGGLAMSRTGASDGQPASPTPATAAPAGYALKVTDVITDCASHAHGRTKTSFQANNCVKATRSLASGRVSGRPVLFVVARIQMASAESAASVKQVLDTTGTGNLNDLLREGRTFPGAPRTMPSSGYASVQTGEVVVVAEAGFADAGPSSSSNPALRAAASKVAGMIGTAS